MKSSSIDLYQVLEINPTASHEDIKAAYRKLVKKHHPDKGGKKETILSINSAWETLKDPISRANYDQSINNDVSFRKEARERGIRNARASAAAKAAKGQANTDANYLSKWLKEVYSPIDKLLGQIINPFPKQLKELSADPYDDYLMESFCKYLYDSKKRLKKIIDIYQSIPTPMNTKSFSLNLYHCLSQVEDAINEFERYTMGYVDNYLHDGREMLKEAKKKRLNLHEERRRINIL